QLSPFAAGKNEPILEPTATGRSADLPIGPPRRVVAVRQDFFRFFTVFSGFYRSFFSRTRDIRCSHPSLPPSHLMTNPAESRPLQFHPNVLLTPPHRFTIVRTNRW